MAFNKVVEDKHKTITDLNRVVEILVVKEPISAFTEKKISLLNIQKME